ncbi:MAG: hypothetical protein ACK4Z6_03820 [Candidatus Methylomirabilales bacterium]
MKPLRYALLLAFIVAGCAPLTAIVAPTPPPAPSKPPPVKKEPPPVLSPQVGREEEDRLKQEAKAKIEGAEHLVKQIDQKKLAKEQEETFLTIQSFLSKAKEALSLKDFLRAFTLADKAQTLADELFHTFR